MESSYSKFGLGEVAEKTTTVFAVDKGHGIY
jgi:hypothetical protein